jgi:predicted small metal-binding protein
MKFYITAWSKKTTREIAEFELEADNHKEAEAKAIDKIKETHRIDFELSVMSDDDFSF